MGSLLQSFNVDRIKQDVHDYLVNPANPVNPVKQTSEIKLSKSNERLAPQNSGC
jgi:hypothetical protein